MEWIFFALAAGVLLYLVLDWTTTKRGRAEAVELSADEQERISQLLADGHQIAAVKALRAAVPQLGLRAAKEVIDQWPPAGEHLIIDPSQRATSVLSPAARSEIELLLANGQRVRAIKRLRDHTDLNLLEAKERIDLWTSHTD
ncbi:hypothetical protein [Glutamicibacter sp. PS]|uniref:hypothetical protein n=1 Tax=Glutamicibacter sp. PS TaxID=3075634 RepID=UPI00284C992F|nr:hypothetical protein [Glutamicibacter sp. PS]MDR4533489.1 hypothetical protein [Glutamicibacter sp. PS]